jgi:hypothetical protein
MTSAAGEEVVALFQAWYAEREKEVRRHTRSAGDKTSQHTHAVLHKTTSSQSTHTTQPYALDTLPISAGAIRSLTELIRSTQCTTMSELVRDLDCAVRALKKFQPPTTTGSSAANGDAATPLRLSSVTMAAACDLFKAYVTRTSLEGMDFAACQDKLIRRGE